MPVCYLKAEGFAFTDLIGCVPVDGDTYDVPAIIETAEKHREYSAVTHVAKDKGIPRFLILHVADHPDTSAQAFRLGSVLQVAGVMTTVQEAQAIRKLAHVQPTRGLQSCGNANPRTYAYEGKPVDNAVRPRVKFLDEGSVREPEVWPRNSRDCGGSESTAA